MGELVQIEYELLDMADHVVNTCDVLELRGGSEEASWHNETRPSLTITAQLIDPKATYLLVRSALLKVEETDFGFLASVDRWCNSRRYVSREDVVGVYVLEAFQRYYREGRRHLVLPQPMPTHISHKSNEYSTIGR